MERDYFCIDGIRCDEVGLRLQKPIEFSQAKPKITTVSVPGRNGDLHYFEGAYSNITGSVNCFALEPGNVDRALNAISKWTLMTPGYHRLETSDEPEIYRMACVIAGAGTEIRMRTLAPFSLTFDCMPQKFFKSGEKEIVITKSGAVLFNDGFPANPQITVNGKGKGMLAINDMSVTFNGDFAGPIILDSDTQNAYYGRNNKNEEITASEFPILLNGKNTIAWSGGVESVSIIPRWWTL